MATYSYRCNTCNNEFEIKMTFKEYEKNKKIKCPLCESPKNKRIIKQVNPVNYVGDGWTNAGKVARPPKGYDK